MSLLLIFNISYSTYFTAKYPKKFHFKILYFRFVRIFLKVCRLKESGQQKKSQKMTLARRILSPFCTVVTLFEWLKKNQKSPGKWLNAWPNARNIPNVPEQSTKLIIEHGAECFLAEKKVLGSAKNVAKKPKEVLIEAYEDLFKTGAFKGSEMDKVIEKIEKVEIKKEKHFDE